VVRPELTFRICFILRGSWFFLSSIKLQLLGCVQLFCACPRRKLFVVCAQLVGIIVPGVWLFLPSIKL
jgi:hypothetical protein